MKLVIKYKMPNAIVKDSAYRKLDDFVTVEDLIELMVSPLSRPQTLFDILDYKFRTVLDDKELLRIGSDVVKYNFFLTYHLKLIVDEVKGLLNFIRDENMFIEVGIDDDSEELEISVNENPFTSSWKREALSHGSLSHS